MQRRTSCHTVPNVTWNLSKELPSVPTAAALCSSQRRRPSPCRTHRSPANRTLCRRSTQKKMPPQKNPESFPGRKNRRVPPAAYVKKSQKYEDRKSSASAFLLVGGAITIFALLCWAGIFDMPMTGFSKYLIQGTLTVMGIGCLIIAVMTFRSAKAMAGDIEAEEKQTEELISWFLSAYRREDIDGRLDADFSDLSEDERNLKRFELISDLLVTSKDLPDQAYVDALCEEIYSKLFDE